MIYSTFFGDYVFIEVQSSRYCKYIYLTYALVSILQSEMGVGERISIIIYNLIKRTLSTYEEDTFTQYLSKARYMKQYFYS